MKINEKKTTNEPDEYRNNSLSSSKSSRDKSVNGNQTINSSRDSATQRSVHQNETIDENANHSTVNFFKRNFNKLKKKSTFYISGQNGTALVEVYLLKNGWKRDLEKNCEDIKLRWCEVKTSNNYSEFREGEQMIYQIPNNKLLTTKIGLLVSLRDYDRVMNKVHKGKSKIMPYQSFFQESYRLDVKDDRNAFFDTYKEKELWISKPTGANQGRGIYLIRSTEEVERIKNLYTEVEEKTKKKRKVPAARLVQRYVTNPLLLDGKKFDVRNYMLIASGQPYVVFYRDGYCRLTCTQYDRNSKDLCSHLTNQAMQKKSPLYEENKEETVWSMDRFNNYVNENYCNENSNKVPLNWVNTILKKKCQQIMLHCFNAVRHRLDGKRGYFDLIGCDFLISDDFQVTLLEMNSNPALHTNCSVLKNVTPRVVEQTLGLSIEVFEKACRGERILPLTTQHDCVLLYNDDHFELIEKQEKIRQLSELRRQAKSAQRRRNFNPKNFIYRRSYNTSKTSTKSDQQKESPANSVNAKYSNTSINKSAVNKSTTSTSGAQSSNRVSSPPNTVTYRNKYKHVVSKVGQIFNVPNNKPASECELTSTEATPTVINITTNTDQQNKNEQNSEVESKMCDYTKQFGKITTVSNSNKLRSNEVKYPPLLIRSQNERLLNKVNRKSTKSLKIASRNSDTSNEEQKAFSKKSFSQNSNFYFKSMSTTSVSSLKEARLLGWLLVENEDEQSKTSLCKPSVAHYSRCFYK